MWSGVKNSELSQLFITLSQNSGKNVFFSPTIAPVEISKGHNYNQEYCSLRIIWRTVFYPLDTLSMSVQGCDSLVGDESLPHPCILWRSVHWSNHFCTLSN